MEYIEHGISIGVNRVDDFFFIKMKIVGKLTHNDYASMTPMLESSLEGAKDLKVKMLLDATEFDGWELRAAWDDFKFGMKYKDLFSKIAIVGASTTDEYLAKVGSWFISGEMEFFSSLDSAYAWLSREEVKPVTPVQKDMHSRKQTIQDDLESLFRSNLRVTGYNVPEPNGQNASEILLEIFEEKLRSIQDDVKAKKYMNY
ncbi:MAG: STAS/SEC14 domain-containing protein [Sulfurimonas sp.]|uniref:STAS/SEC14 domain-containing protein n=1 Tax=Sulfurimonas sp. TaxID=2022749 RepID=UPI0025E35A7B|nr:STAS/SEC14 domain-containing protein [Sulfurimonas sp.]MCK9491234.1 STAS/SEC14 domain-containing protein [Sulfurimonas sp.]